MIQNFKVALEWQTPYFKHLNEIATKREGKSTNWTEVCCPSWAQRRFSGALECVWIILIHELQGFGVHEPLECPAEALVEQSHRGPWRVWPLNTSVASQNWSKATLQIFWDASSTALNDKKPLKMSSLGCFFFSQSLLCLLCRDNSEGKLQHHRKCKRWKHSQSKLILTSTLIFAETVFSLSTHPPSQLWLQSANRNELLVQAILKSLLSLDLDFMSNASHNSLITLGCLAIEHWFPFTYTDLKSSGKMPSFEGFTWNPGLNLSTAQMLTKFFCLLSTDCFGD